MTRTAKAFAPGRINLIGEHVDYNGGTVLPAPLAIGVTAELSARSDTMIAIASDGYDALDVRHLGDEAAGGWSDPVVGALRAARELGLIESGANVDITALLPQGAGLSSSAALIIAVLRAARALAPERAAAQVSDLDLAIAARQVENNFMGVPCGIMDQMAVALGQPGYAMALDTATLGYRMVPLPQTHDFVAIHSGLTRQLADGRYGARKAECDAAKRYFATENLCALDPAVIASAQLAEAPRKRALHCVNEQARTLDAIAALETGDIARLGARMDESHASLRDLFEVSLEPIDALVESAREHGAIGARLTGGGFGGCVVACVESGHRADWLSRLLRDHPDARFIAAIGGQNKPGQKKPGL
ncbi:galactokinase [Qipengyuania nanhaisediminis]|uniref:galactokinase n=1 Tax=Qipengyuania nanhaisediminis TaxID=604088 RepID=UPI0038B257E2